MLLKVAKMFASVVPSYPFAPEGNLFWKVDWHHFRLPIEPHHSTAFQINPETRLHNFGSDWPQIAYFAQEIYSGKIYYYFCVPIVFYLTTTFQNKSRRVDHHIRLHNFGPNWAWPCPPKGNFWEKLASIALVFHIPLCYIISKKMLREQIIRLHDVCPNCPFPQKGIFLENWLLLLISNYWTPLC